MKHEDIEGKSLPLLAFRRGNDGTAQRFRILRYDLAGEGCTVKSLLIENLDMRTQPFRCAVDMVYLTADPVYAEIVEDLQDTIKNCNATIVDAENTRASALAHLRQMRSFLDDTSHPT